VAYATIADVEAIVGADTLRDIADHNSDHVRDDAVIQLALDDAAALIDTYHDEVIDPLNVPRVLKRANVIIAVNDMRESRDQGTEGSRLAYGSVISWLKLVADGKAEIVKAPPDPTGGVDPGDPEVDGLERVWSRASARLVF
jgi:phage gp36-like protein